MLQLNVDVRSEQTATMEHTVRGATLSSDELRRKKTSFTLDLASTKATTPVASRPSKQDVVRDGILASPDVGLLALATPDLERFILQHTYGAAAAAAAGATTPPGAAAASIASTPTQVLFPRSVTEEQEAYARGFIDALLELHRQQQHRQQAATSPLVQVVPDPRTNYHLPTASPEDRQPSLYTALTSVSHAPAAAASSSSEDTNQRSLPEFLPTLAGLPFPALHPSPVNASPAARRSAVVPSFNVNRIPPFINDAETLDLSPSGRLASRTLEHTVSQKTSNSVPMSGLTVLPHLPPDANSSATVVQPIPPVLVPIPSQDVVAEKPVELPVQQQSPEAVTVTAIAPVAMEVVEESTSNADSLPVRPIDMSVQEQAKLERKREKNRYAAQKCRMLKLERIDRLQHRVNELKSQNAALEQNASTLCEQVNRLRQMIVEHVEGGCQVMMVHSAS